MRRLPSLAAAGLAAAAAMVVGPAAAPAGAGPLPVPTFTVTPSTDLRDGQTVHTEWTNQFVGLTEIGFGIWECLPGAWSVTTCDFKGDADAAPKGSADVTVSKTVRFTTCGTGATQCSVRLASNRDVEKGSVDITFTSK